MPALYREASLRDAAEEAERLRDEPHAELLAEGTIHNRRGCCRSRTGRSPLHVRQLQPRKRTRNCLEVPPNAGIKPTRNERTGSGKEPHPQHISAKRRSGFGLNDLLGAHTTRWHYDCDGLRVQHRENRNSAPTNPPVRISHDSHNPGPRTPQAQTTQLHGNSPKSDVRPGAAKQKPQRGDPAATTTQAAKA